MSAALVLGFSLILAAGAGPHASAAIPRATPAATGSFGLRVVHQAADETSDPRSWYYIIANVKPGTVVHRVLEIGNQTSRTGHFAVYAAAASTSNGLFSGAGGHTQNQLSSWTRASPAAPWLRSGARTTIAVTITVPKNAAPGARCGVVWAQLQGDGGAGVSSSSRVGIRIYFTVSPR